MDDREELISMECAHLRQADRFIKEGRVRLLNQQNLVSELTEGRYQIKEAQRLAEFITQSQQAVPFFEPGLPQSKIRSIIEALIWLCDVAGLSRDEAKELMMWSAHSLLRAILTELTEAHPSHPARAGDEAVRDS